MKRKKIANVWTKLEANELQEVEDGGFDFWKFINYSFS